MVTVLGEEPEFLNKLIKLVHDLDEIAVSERLADNQAATNCAQAAAALRSWIDAAGLGPITDPLPH